VIVNIEAEYNDYISDKWEKLADQTADICKPHRQQDLTYNTISGLSIRFLQEKLKNLESHDA
jgi:tRNA U34 5-carboxymethylaminomethyl modifying enzyme MnmG/GidA